MSHQALYIFLAAFIIFLTYVLSPILTPFIFGALLAYLANPLVKRLDQYRVPHLLSVSLVFVLLLLIFGLIVLMMVPLILNQINVLIASLPELLQWVQNTAIPWAHQMINVNTLQATITSSLSKAGTVISTVLYSSYTLIEWLVNLVLIPVVFFYLLRDWDKVRAALFGIVPKAGKPTFTKLVRQCDEVLGAFFRGQLLVMVGLVLIYGIGLSVIGLKLGFIIGLIGGILTIVPYLGSLFVLLTASFASIAQYGGFDHLPWVLLVFLIGQGIEGYILSPYFVGQRIGLHPVVVIFSVLAGGTLFGFFGVLAALPAAAVIKVLLMHLREKYS